MRFGQIIGHGAADALTVHPCDVSEVLEEQARHPLLGDFPCGGGPGIDPVAEGPKAFEDFPFRPE